MIDMSTRLGGLTLPSPVLTASGTAGWGPELARFVELDTLGAVITPTVMAAAWAGRPTPRIAETPSGVLTAVGLEGPGINAFLTDELPRLAAAGARVVVSIAGAHSDEFADVARALAGQPAVVAIEANISAPTAGGRTKMFAADVIASSRVIGAVRRAADPAQPVFAKLTPDVTDIAHLARVCASAGADGFSLINTALGLVIDTHTLAPALADGTGGLSGPALRPIALRCVWQVRQAVRHLPIIGMGGVGNGLDALQFVLAGASAVAVGTANLRDPRAPMRVLTELEQALSARGFVRFADAVGYAHLDRDRRAARVPTNGVRT